MRKARFWLIFAVVAAVVGGGAYYYAQVTDQSGMPASAAIAPSEGGVAVEAARAKIDTVVEDIRAVGTLRPNEAVTVVSEIAGRVERIGFREGQAVVAGEVLIELDASILRAELGAVLAPV
jgi:membrane fusion protein, multidrug efflux system